MVRKGSQGYLGGLGVNFGRQEIDQARCLKKGKAGGAKSCYVTGP